MQNWGDNDMGIMFSYVRAYFLESLLTAEMAKKCLEWGGYMGMKIALCGLNSPATCESRKEIWGNEFEFNVCAKQNPNKLCGYMKWAELRELPAEVLESGGGDQNHA